MARPTSTELSARELEVMHLFWQNKELTALEARDLLEREGRELTYVTVANLIRALEQKKFLEQLNPERPFKYRAQRSYQEVSHVLLKDMIGKIFSGSRKSLLRCLFDQETISAEEKEILLEIIEKKKAKEKQKGENRE